MDIKSPNMLDVQSNSSKLLSTSSRFARSSVFGGTPTQSPMSRKPGIDNSISCVNQTLAGIKSNCYVVENFGYQLPVEVNEALTFTENCQNISVKCSPQGWAWLVHGRRLFVWQYKEIRRNHGDVNKSCIVRELAQAGTKRGSNRAQCRELTLPHSDIGHKASLVTVFFTEGQQIASCIAASPTGDVRYWSSIAHDNISTDETNILYGQEFDQLLNVPHQKGYILATTTCNLLFLQIQTHNGRHVLFHKVLRQPTGFLGGFSKRMASLLIGTNNSSDAETKLVSVAYEGSRDGQSVIAVLSENSIQRWCLTNNGRNEQFLFEDADILRKIREEFIKKYWQLQRPVDHSSIQLYLLDMKVSHRVYILAGALNKTHIPNMLYGVAIFSMESATAQLDDFIALSLKRYFSPQTERDCLSMRFSVSRSHLYLYISNEIYPLQLANVNKVPDIESEKIELQSEDDMILTVTISENLPIFFCRSHGLVSVKSGDLDSSDIYNLSTHPTLEVYSPISVRDNTTRDQSILGGSHENNLLLTRLDPNAIYNEFKDEVSQLKAAFIARRHHNNKFGTQIVTELMESIANQGNISVSESYLLDRIVITIAEDLVEDLPAADPRWEFLYANSERKLALGSSYSMQILTQLKDKNFVLRHFIEFLHSTGIWEKLNAVPSAGGSVLKPTCYVISDVNEKVIAAIALRMIQNRQPALVDEAIELTVAQWQETPEGSLTVHDIFYVKLCKFQVIFQAFVDMIDIRLRTQNINPSSLAACIRDINEIILDVVTQVLNFREQSKELFVLPSGKIDTTEYLPWTAMSGNTGLRDQLSYLIDVSVRYGTRSTNDPEVKQKLYHQILELIDIILNGRQNYLESILNKEKYSVLLQQFESQRGHLISILIDEQQYEYAAKLAEKYLDFQSLVIICDKTDNKDRLDSYIKKFEAMNFSQFAINWHLRQNRRGELFEKFKDNQAALAHFLRDHPTLSWIQLVFNGDFERASRVLLQLAESEVDLLQRKKLMLSLAKLATLAVSESDLTLQVDTINAELDLVAHQESLSEELLRAYGYDTQNQRVLTPDEIIDLIISEENENVNEFQFRTALAISDFLSDPSDARIKIWCAIILRDNWINYDASKALDYVRSLLFFRVVETCHLMNVCEGAFLPSMEQILSCSALGDLTDKKCFQYLLKLTYECVESVLNDASGFMEY